jgi:hypothetical protein
VAGRGYILKVSACENIQAYLWASDEAGFFVKHLVGWVCMAGVLGLQYIERAFDQ